MQMKITAIVAAGLLMAAVPAMAQSNATVQGGGTTPGNSAGEPSNVTPQGQVSTTQVGPSSVQPGQAGSTDAQSATAPK